jgi:hypothetical protein
MPLQKAQNSAATRLQYPQLDPQLNLPLIL